MTVAIEPTHCLKSRLHWKVYLIEASLLGIFMVSACVFTVLLEYPSSPLHGVISSEFIRRMLIGIAMGLTAIVLIYSPIGKRSGAHMNPALTLSFLYMGRITAFDAAFYITAQFIGAAVGVALMLVLFGAVLVDPTVRYVVTTPGPSGELPAWIGEFVITFILMMVVLHANKSKRLMRCTGLFAGFLVALYITFEAPLSGMSMNPARTFGSAFIGQIWTGWWIYFTAPLAGMLAAIESQRLLFRQPQALCGKLTHSNRVACFIKCDCLNDSTST